MSPRRAAASQAAEIAHCVRAHIPRLPLNFDKAKMVSGPKVLVVAGLSATMQERRGTEERAPARAYVPAGTSRLVRPGPCARCVSGVMISTAASIACARLLHVVAGKKLHVP